MGSVTVICPVRTNNKIMKTPSSPPFSTWFQPPLCSRVFFPIKFCLDSIHPLKDSLKCPIYWEDFPKAFPIAVQLKALPLSSPAFYPSSPTQLGFPSCTSLDTQIRFYSGGNFYFFMPFEPQVIDVIYYSLSELLASWSCKHSYFNISLHIMEASWEQTLSSTQHKGGNKRGAEFISNDEGSKMVSEARLSQ